MSYIGGRSEDPARFRLEAVCLSAVATLRSPAAQQMVGASGARVFLEDSTASRKVTLGRGALEQRSPQLLDGTQVTVMPNHSSGYNFTPVRFAWSHDDQEYWVSEWPDGFRGSRDGRFSAFNLREAQNPGEYVFTVRGEAANRGGCE